ncbi:MAG: hypothetical protein ACK4MQ_00010 [Hyphomonas sp.]
MDAAAILNFSEKRAGLLLSAALMISLLLIGAAGGRIGAIGPDGDDVMRLVQVRELLAGQGWFDLRQPRLGPEGGTLMHWSRLVDLPMVLITLLLTPLIGEEAALAAAITLWPVLSIAFVSAAIVIGARALSPAGSEARTLLLFAALIAVAMLFRHFRFLPGAIDHHNLQLGMIGLAMALLLDPARRAVASALAGLVLAGAVAIGADIYPFVALIAVFVALDWAVAGRPAESGTAAFGTGFALGLSVCFAVTVAPDDYALVFCDALSSITFLAGATGGLGLALAARASLPGGWTTRFALLGLIAAACGGLALVFAPHCLSNPLSALPPEVQTLWLARVDEALPTLALMDGQVSEVAFRLGPALAGLGAAIWLLALRPEARRSMSLLGLLCLAALILSLYQTRFYVFGHVFAILPLAALAARLHAGAVAGAPRLAYLAVLALSLPFLWAAVGGPFDRPAAPAASDAGQCDLAEAIRLLNTLPEGRILAPASDTPRLLLDTRHSALNGHYHRNAAGTAAAIGIFTGPPEAAGPAIRSAGVTYVLHCPADPDLGFFARHAPGGFIASLQSGETPAWLAPLKAGGGYTIYRADTP